MSNDKTKIFKAAEFTPTTEQVRAVFATAWDRTSTDVAKLIWFDRWLAAHDAAVEAAVRADQIEKDAALALNVVPIVDDSVMEAHAKNIGMVVAAAIRAQLPVTGLDTPEGKLASPVPESTTHPKGTQQ